MKTISIIEIEDNVIIDTNVFIIDPPSTRLDGETEIRIEEAEQCFFTKAVANGAGSNLIDEYLLIGEYRHNNYSVNIIWK